ncbi:MAG: hypothetical protein IJX96_03125 [Clostridia bacterium]|nr:hypothetical protein [Clostridia bacterium]
MSEKRKNKKKWVTYIVFTILLVMIVLCCFSICRKQRETGNVINVILNEDGADREKLETDIITLYPSGSDEYILKITCKVSGRYALTFAFTAESTPPLAEQVSVEIVGETSETSGNLGTLLQGETLAMEENFTRSSKTELKVKYTMSKDVGNEGKGAKIDFDLVLTAQKVG